MMPLNAAQAVPSRSPDEPGDQLPPRPTSSAHKSGAPFPPLAASLQFVRDRLISRLKDAATDGPRDLQPLASTPQQSPLDTRAFPASERLVELQQGFQLSAFESLVIVTCAGLELASDFAELCGKLHGDGTAAYPTFGMLATVFGEADWGALMPNGPLRAWELLDFDPSVRPLAGAPLRLNERILHHLMGQSDLDAALLGTFVPIRTQQLTPSHATLARQTAAQLLSLAQDRRLPLVRLDGVNTPNGMAIVAEICKHSGTSAYRLSIDDIPSRAYDRARFAQRWNREWILARRLVFVDANGRTSTDCASAERFMDALDGMVISNVACGSGQARPVLHIRVPAPTLSERQAMWRQAMADEGVSAPAQLVSRVACHFKLSWSEIRTAALRYGAESRASARPLSKRATTQADRSRLWKTCCEVAHPGVDALLERIEPKATWKDLILPERQQESLVDIVREVNQRAAVHGRWGFAERHSRGLGVAAVFVGPSGTGKTLAAEVVAHSLRLDLYRVDLSSVVSKYIGETAKNLQRVFDAAERGGSVLLFDEADALFGKRSEVKDSRDRYANIEVSYLLQRMDAYSGVSILTTNMREGMDVAFLRRLRRIVRFPFPERREREAIWRRVFPRDTPTSELDYADLAALKVCGGSIYNIALGACFIAAEQGTPVHMSHLYQSAKAEYAKLDKTLPTHQREGGRDQTRATD